MPDTLELRLHIARRGDIAVGEMSEVELDGRLQAPLDRHLVDGDGAFTAIHGGGEMPRRIEMRAVVGGEVDMLDRPAFTVWQVRLLESGKEFADIGRSLPMIEIVD